jgi:hypothetical protein
LMGCVRRYADCGAGVGRITDQFLLHAFHEVDILEPLVGSRTLIPYVWTHCHSREN